MFSRSVPVIAVVLACAVSPVRADEPKQKMVRKVYSVADLVVPIVDCDGGPPLPAPAQPAKSCSCPLACGDLEFMCEQPDEPPCHTGADCCPNGACCPDGPCCAIGCCVKCVTNWSAIAAPECYPPTPAPKPTAESNSAKLIQLITSTVRPSGWAACGGVNDIEYFPLGYGLVVNAPADVQEQVADMLDALRRLMDVEVAVEVRLVTVGDEMYERLGTDSASFLNDSQLALLMQTIQGDRRTNVMQAPKLTVFSGQKAVIRCTDQRFFVTNINTTIYNGIPVHVPVNNAFSTGFEVAVRATATAGRESVRCELAVENCELDGEVPMIPFTTLITPVFEGGAQGQPVPFTQYIQQPKFVKRGVAKSLTIPTGETAVLYAGKRTKPEDCDAPQSTAAPMFEWLDGLADLFCPPVVRPNVNEHLLVLVTPRVIVSEETQAQADARPMPMGPAVADASPLLSGGIDFNNLDNSFRPCAVPAPPCQPAPTVRQCAAMGDAPVCQQVAPPMVMPCPAPICPRKSSAIPPAASSQPVQLDVCVMSMDPAVWDQPIAASWSDISPKACGDKTLLGPGEVSRFCQLMKRYEAMNVIAEPKLITMCGRPATFQSGGMQVGVRSVNFSDNGTEFVRQATPFGINVTFLADTMPGGIYLQCDCDVSGIRPTKEYRVTIQGPGEEPRTETVQVIGESNGKSHIAAAVPTGKTLLLHCGRDAAGKDVIVTVTPHVINTPTVSAPPMPAPCGLGVESTAMPPPPPAVVPAGYTAPAYEPQLVTGQFAPPGTIVDPKLERLLTKYRWACEDGDIAEARKLAQQCLAIDPTCFGK